MIGNGPQHGFKVPSRSIYDIRKIAESIATFFNITDIGNMSISKFLDGLSEYGITYDVLDVNEMPHKGVEACCIPENLYIGIRRDVFEAACLNEPRARFTVMHEFGHLILGHRRTINREDQDLNLKTYEDSEWQANQFAAEFLMPYWVMKTLKVSNTEEIQRLFNVSHPAAERRINQLNKRGEL